MNERKQHTILFDCERMKHQHNGLYHFCWNLGKSLLKVNEGDTKFCFYTPPSAIGIFGKDACYIKQHSFQKFRLPDTSKIDIWHNTYQSSLYVPKRRKVKFLLTVHDLNFLYKENKSLNKKKKFLKEIKEKIRRADQVVAISHFTLNDLKKHIEIDNKPCEVIYNGCNIEEINNLEPPAFLPNAPFLFTIGTILEKKNFHVLPCLLAGNDRLLIIAGISQNKGYKNKIIEEAKKWKVEDRLIFTGPISENDKQWYYKNCQAFLFPSISEGFGLPVVEAMYFGKPVVLSNFTSLPEIGGPEASYFLGFDPGHMNEVVDASINQYDSAKADRIKQWAKKFNWEASAKQYLNLYSKLLEK